MQHHSFFRNLAPLSKDNQKFVAFARDQLVHYPVEHVNGKRGKYVSRLGATHKYQMQVWFLADSMT